MVFNTCNRYSDTLFLTGNGFQRSDSGVIGNVFNSDVCVSGIRIQQSEKVGLKKLSYPLKSDQHSFSFFIVLFVSYSPKILIN